MLTLYTAPTTNGRKITIFLELLGVPYIFKSVKPFRETRTEWYLKINPCGQIPTISIEEEEFNLAESGAILSYLTDKYDSKHKFSFPRESKLYWCQLQFLFFHASGLSVAQESYNRDKSEANKEATIKAYKVFEDQLSKNGTGYLVGDHLSLADIIALPDAVHFKNGELFDLVEFPCLSKWVETFLELQEVKDAYSRV